MTLPRAIQQLSPQQSQSNCCCRLVIVPSLWLLVLVLQSPLGGTSFVPTPTIKRNAACHHHIALPRKNSSLSSTTATVDGIVIGPRLAINENFPGLQKIYSNPDIFVIQKFLEPPDCQDLIQRALEKRLERSPVAYAGWTDDFKDLVELAAKGPVAWIALVAAWFQVKDGSGSQIDLVIHALQNYVVAFVLVTAMVAALTYSRAEGLKSLRTSTSTTLDDMTDATSGTRKFVQQAAKLFDSRQDDNLTSSTRDAAALFEAPTVIRYEADQVLAPHYDANRSADTEDANRGGQTLATLLVYLNDVEQGGLTRFGKLNGAAAVIESARSTADGKLVVQPKMGDALLFFPADSKGTFDPRTEHEGMPAIDEKWIARIWRHEQRVPPPFGLSESALARI